MQVKFLNLNICHGGLLFDKVIEFISLEKADIINLQEVYNGIDEKLAPNFRSLQIINKKFPEYEFYFSPELLLKRPEGKINIGNSIFSKFSIVKKQTIFFDIPYGEYDYQPPNINFDFSKQPKNMQWITITVDEKTVHIFNLHGIWGRDGEDNERRIRMSQKVVEAVKGKEYVILAGDFNTLENTRTISNIDKYLVNVFKGELTTTFNMKRKSDQGYATAVVDMVFVSPNIKVIKHYCQTVDISDHLPLVCVFEI